MNRKRVVIVDDEYLIRELLHEKIDWDKLQCEIVHKASCASEVYDFIDEEEVDLIITDINMPYIDGMTMSKRIKNEYPKIKIIVLTGYNEFDYAKQGIDIGIEGFILKPIDKDEVEPVIEKVIQKIDSELRQELEYNQLVERIEEDKPYLKEKFFFDILQDKITQEKIDEKAKRYGIDSKASGYRIAVMQPDTSETEHDMNLDILTYQCRMLVENYFSKASKSDTEDLDADTVHVFDDASESILFLFTDEGARVYDELKYCRRLINENLGVDSKVGISGLKGSMILLPEAALEAKNCLRHAFVEKQVEICSYDEFNVDSGEDFDIIKEQNRIKEQLSQLQFYLKSGLGSEVDSALDSIFESYRNIVASSYYDSSNYVQIQLARIISSIQQTVLGMGMGAIDELTKDTRYMELSNYGKVQEVRTLSDLKEWIDEYCKVILKYISKNIKNKDENVIDSINAYMMENLGNSSFP